MTSHAASLRIFTTFHIVTHTILRRFELASKHDALQMDSYGNSHTFSKLVMYSSGLPSLGYLSSLSIRQGFFSYLIITSFFQWWHEVNFLPSFFFSHCESRIMVLTRIFSYIPLRKFALWKWKWLRRSPNVKLIILWFTLQYNRFLFQRWRS